MPKYEACLVEKWLVKASMKTGKGPGGETNNQESAKGCMKIWETGLIVMILGACLIRGVVKSQDEKRGDVGGGSQKDFRFKSHLL